MLKGVQNTETRRVEVEEWIDFLCRINGEKDYENLLRLFYDYIYSEQKAIMTCVKEFQNYIKFNFDTPKITQNIIDEYISNNNYNKVLECMEFLFLEPIKDKQFYTSNLKIAIKLGLNGECIVKWYHTGQRHKALLLHPGKGI